MGNKTSLEYTILIFYIFWGWIFSKTIFSSNSIIYLFFLTILGIFVIKTVKLFYKNETFSPLVFVWSPFYLYVAFSFLNSSSFEFFSYWIIGFMIILNAKHDLIINNLPYKLIVYGGIFMGCGIIYQMMFPNLYFNTVRPYLLNESIDNWTNANYGFNGFAYQLGVAAQILLAAELVIICLKDKVLTILKNKYIYVIFVALILICILLTGKRMNAVIAIIIPVFLYLVKQKYIFKQILFLSFISIVVALVFTYLADNAEALLDFPLTKRYVLSIINSSEGESNLNGREFLWEKAYNLFQNYPILGAGPVFSDYYGSAVHNSYLQCLCEYGIVGIILYVFPLLYCLILTIKLCRTTKSCSFYPYILYSFACQINYIIEGFTDNTLINRNGFLMYAIAIAILIHYKTNLHGRTNESCS